MTRSIDPFLSHLLHGHMNSIDARMEIEQTYTLEDFKEIANHGCQSGVCFKHIYYGDTNKFFETYEDQITEYIEDAYSTNFLVELFRDADASLTVYQNSVTWCFIEMIAFEVTDGIEIYHENYSFA